MIFEHQGNKIYFFILLISASINLLSFINSNQKWSQPIACDSLNTQENDFAPCWNKFEEQLYFNSDIKGKSYFYSSKLKENNFLTPKFLKADINVPNSNKSFITFLREDEAILSAYRNSTAQSYLNLYRSFKKKNSWSEPTLLDSLADDSFNSHPTVSPDGSLLIFSSDRRNSRHETDLWCSYRLDNGQFSQPVNLEELNSDGNEITPFLASNDTLYFSSDGHEGAGGYDIFVSVFQDGLWQRPIPLTDLNTEWDESDFVLINSHTAVFCSNRPGGKGKLDLYMAKKINASEHIVINNNIELDCSLSAKTISLKNDYEYTLIPAIPYLHIELLRAMNQSNFEQREISAALINLNQLSARMNINKSSFLNIKYNPKVGGDIQKSLDDLKKYFILSGLSANSIAITADTNILPVEFVQLVPNANNLLLPLETGISNFSSEQKILEINLDGRPKSNIYNWACSLKSNNKILDSIASSNLLPFIWKINIENHLSSIWDCDSLIIEFKAEDDLKNQFSKTASLIIEHNKNLKKKYFSSLNGNFDYYYMVVPNLEQLEINYSIRSYTAKIIESAEFSNGIEIIIFSDKMFETAERLKDLLNKLIPATNAKPINIRFTQEKPQTIVPPYMMNYFLEIRVKKD